MITVNGPPEARRPLRLLLEDLSEVAGVVEAGLRVGASQPLERGRVERAPRQDQRGEDQQSERRRHLPEQRGDQTEAAERHVGADALAQQLGDLAS